MITKEPKIQFVNITSHQEIRAMSSLYFHIMAFYAVYSYRNPQLSSERNLMEFVSGKLKFSTFKILCLGAALLSIFLLP